MANGWDRVRTCDRLSPEQTLHSGEPVALFTVSRELGHSNTKLVEEVYGHLAKEAHRSEVIEYRVSQHRAKLKSHLTTLRAAARLALVKSA